MSKINDLNTELEEYVEDAETIKNKIQTVATAKDISIIRGTDTPSSVLDKINAGTVKTPSGTKNIDSNGITDVSLFQYVDVNVSPNVSEKTITNNGTYLASDENVDGFSKVVVDVQGGGAEPVQRYLIVQNADGSIDITTTSSMDPATYYQAEGSVLQTESQAIRLDQYFTIPRVS